MQAFIDHLIASGVGDNAVGLGDTAPEFSLPDPAERQVSLASVLESGPAVLSFYRGRWCPYCSEELVALQRELPEIDRLGATLVAISPQLPDDSMPRWEQRSLAFPILTDRGNAVARSYGLEFQMPGDAYAELAESGVDLEVLDGDDSRTLPVPATYVLDRSRRVTFAFVDPDFRKRADPADVVATLRRMHRGEASAPHSSF